MVSVRAEFLLLSATLKASGAPYYVLTKQRGWKEWRADWRNLSITFMCCCDCMHVSVFYVKLAIGCVLCVCLCMLMYIV